MKIDLTNYKIINIPKELNGISVVSVIKELNDFLKQNEINTAELNFVNTNFAYPSGLTPLLAYLSEYKKNNNYKTCIVINSKGSRIDNYIRRMGFYSLLGLKDNYPWLKWSGNGRFQEPYFFMKDTSPNDVTQKSDNIIKTFIKDRNARNYNEAIGWCINEIVDNAHNHSKSDYNVIMAQKYSDGITEFCVADRGIGIKQSMGLDDTKNALEQCITRQKGVSSTGMGNGLFYTTELIKRDNSGKCSMTIWTENQMLLLHSNTNPTIKKVDGYWQGVNISISMYNGISESLTELMNGQYSFSYENMPEYYDNLFEN
ncbi:hypothetical protein IKE67_01190 [bacterium]|nr:hypothetical protein [bacterium]